MKLKARISVSDPGALDQATQFDLIIDGNSVVIKSTKGETMYSGWVDCNQVFDNIVLEFAPTPEMAEWAFHKFDAAGGYESITESTEH